MVPHYFCNEYGIDSASGLALQTDGPRTAGRTLRAFAQRADVNLQFLHGSAERVAVHTQFARCLALVAPVLFEDRDDEPLLEFADRLRVENVAANHLQNDRFH